MKGIYKLINDTVREKSVKIHNKQYSAEFTTKSKKYVVRFPSEKNVIKFDKYFINNIKSDRDKLYNVIEVAILKLQYNQGLTKSEVY